MSGVRTSMGHAGWDGTSRHPRWGYRSRKTLFPVHGDVAEAAVWQRGFVVELTTDVVELMGVNGYGLSFLSVM